MLKHVEKKIKEFKAHSLVSRNDYDFFLIIKARNKNKNKNKIKKIKRDVIMKIGNRSGIAGRLVGARDLFLVTNR